MNLQRSIPGETPLDDISGLKIKGVITRKQLNEVEFLNIATATAKYITTKPSPRKAPFSRKWMLQLHKEMFGKVWKWAGRIRTCRLNIGVEPHRIEAELENLTRDIMLWNQSDSLLADSAILHYRAVRIHPFMNGNGRWGRLLANIWLRQQGEKIIFWPETDTSASGSDIRDNYLSAVKQADLGDMEALVELHKRYAQRL